MLSRTVKVKTWRPKVWTIAATLKSFKIQRQQYTKQGVWRPPYEGGFNWSSYSFYRHYAKLILSFYVSNSISFIQVAICTFLCHVYECLSQISKTSALTRDSRENACLWLAESVLYFWMQISIVLIFIQKSLKTCFTSSFGREHILGYLSEDQNPISILYVHNQRNTMTPQYEEAGLDFIWPQGVGIG